MIAMPIMTDPKTMPNPRQTEILQFVHRLTLKLGHPPRISEINEALGVSPAGVRVHLLALEKKCLIEFEQGERRGRMKRLRSSKALLKKLTPRQIEVLAAIEDFERRLGHAPTMAEINQDLEMSQFGVHAPLLELEQKGALSFEKSERRGPVTITKEGKKWL